MLSIVQVHLRDSISLNFAPEKIHLLASTHGPPLGPLHMDQKYQIETHQAR